MIEERTGRTLLIAVLVALACSSLVSVSVEYLRPKQRALAQLERNAAILEVTDQHPQSDRDVVNAYLGLDHRLLDIESKSLISDVRLDPVTFDHWALTEDSEHALSLTGADNEAQLGWISRYVPIYLLWDETELDRVILPVHGKGMWSMLYGHIALAADFSTIEALNIFRHGETAGIGDRIQDPAWENLWRGRPAFDPTGALAVSVDKSLGKNDTADPYRVDLITGASVTSIAVGNQVRFWLGPQGYGPWLARLRDGDVVLAR